MRRFFAIFLLITAVGCECPPEPELATLSEAAGGQPFMRVVKIYPTRLVVERYQSQCGKEAEVLFTATLKPTEIKMLQDRLAGARSVELKESYTSMVQDGTNWLFRFGSSSQPTKTTTISNYYGADLDSLAELSDTVDALLPEQFRIRYGAAARRAGSYH
ncbi:MAG: hypothetical protein JWM57_3569 [Phycisphaerales bacterium]|nr:hypothetical protein [Phycisphaerales bacterium]